MDVSIPLKCPSCGRVGMVRVRYMRLGSHTICRDCGARVNFSGDDMTRFQRQMSRLVRGINKRLRISLGF